MLWTACGKAGTGKRDSTVIGADQPHLVPEPRPAKTRQHLSVDIHPLPKLDELVESAAGNSYYATLDMKDAYYQVMLDEASRDVTTFSEGVALYRFKRLPFGLSCSAAIFARQLAQMLAPLLKENWLRSYLDDIIIYAPTYNTLLQRLDKLFKHMTGRN